MSYKYYIDKKKYRIKPEECYVRVKGWCFETTGTVVDLYAMVDGKKVASEKKEIERPDVYKKYRKKYKLSKKIGFALKIPIEKESVLPCKIEVFARSSKGVQCIATIKNKELVRIKDDSTISYNIDFMMAEKNKIQISGWATSVYGLDNLNIDIYEKDGRTIEELRLSRRKREDLLNEGMIKEEDKNCGFILEFPYEKDWKYELILSDQKRCKHITLNPKQIELHYKCAQRIGFTKQMIKCINPHTVKKAVTHIGKYGFSGLKEYVVSRVNTMGKPYQEWFEENRASQDELENQKKYVFPYQPKISIIVPTYKTPLNFFREMVDSVLNQTYGNWELCIADGSEGDEALEAELERYKNADGRIKYKLLQKNEGISGNTNAALAMAEGDYIGLFDHDDILAPNALYEIVKALQEKEYDIIYTDEDKVDGDGKKHMDPNFKPDFSMDLFLSHNYITHFFVVKTEIIKGIGGFRSEYDGSQDYDLMFRCIEKAKTIKHIPQILYHWRIHMNSVAGDPASKMYAYEAGKKAIEAHLQRVGVAAKVEHTGLWGMYHVIYETPGNPLVSIIIPNKDHVEDLDKCVRSIINKSIYHNYEIIIVENNSEREETFQYYNKLTEEFENVKVVYWKEGFNYSAINNFGVSFAKGEYLLFLNNDTEMINETALKELLGCCMRKEVGAVGAKLLYSDDTVQHGGVVLGFGGYAGHVHVGIGKDDYGYMVRARINCNYSAVTAACLLTKKELFEEVGGFDEQFVVACNDVDYCLKLRKIDKLIVYNAFSEWYHYESKSRGYEDTPEKVKRFEGEVEKFRNKWINVLNQGDPFYNPNFNINGAPFTLK